MMNRIITAQMNRKQYRRYSRSGAIIPMNLQLFADDGDDEGDDGDDNGSGGNDDDGDDDDKGGEDEKKYTQADIDRIVKQRLAKAAKAAEKKSREAAEAEKLKNMSKEEKRDAEFKQMQQELAELKAEKRNADMLSSASDILKDAGINVSSKLVAHLIADTAEETKANVDEFVKLYQDAVNKGVKAAMKANGSSPKKKSDGDGGWTKEKIMAVKNPTERQKLIREHMNLFK